VRAPSLLLPLLLLAGCGALPEPFAGHPGALGARLAAPPPARLAVPPPAAALLTNAAGKRLAGAVADALVEREVPAFAQTARPGDWRLDVTAELQNNQVLPKYIIRDERGRVQGSAMGVAMPAAAWSLGDPLALKMEAAAIAPKLADLLVTIDAMRKRSDPHSIYNRPAQVAVPDVTGAPGDGNESLALAMRRQLPQLGDMVQETPAGADFVVAGQVHTAPEGANTRIEIQWRIIDAAGHDLGQVVQLNDVPSGSLDHYWGDVALVVAQQAAGGVQEVIDKQKTAPKTASKTSPTPTPAASVVTAPASAGKPSAAPAHGGAGASEAKPASAVPSPAAAGSGAPGAGGALRQ
jgi:hypothetical protein